LCPICFSLSRDPIRKRLLYRPIYPHAFVSRTTRQPKAYRPHPKPMATTTVSDPAKLERGLGLLDATMIVVGSMIGSGIFITSAESSRLVGSPGWLLMAWALAGVLTITGALCCAELAAMWPRAGGQYVFLREAFGPSIGFLFGWGLFLIIQSGTIAAVAVAFANFTGVLTSSIA